MLEDRLRKILSDKDVHFKDKRRTLVGMPCPKCGKSDKTSMLKANGAIICYRGSCGFKGFFKDWLVEMYGITYEEAKSLLRGEVAFTSDRLDPKFDEDQEWQPEEEVTLDEIKWPLPGLVDVSDEIDAVKYMVGRGITSKMVAKYEIKYDSLNRRIIYPIKVNGKCYGWQGRAIDKSAGLKMRNNDGFRRDLLVMFYDNLTGSDHAILAEGPVDAIKFDLVGGNVATMGKNISWNQIDMVLSTGVRKLYLALDDDAAKQINEISSSVEIDVYWIKVPESARLRCAAVNKKADFGECTVEECAQAFSDAKKYDVYSLATYIA